MSSDNERPVFEFRPRGKQRADDQHSEPVALSDLLLPALTRLGLRTRARQVQVTNAWPGVVGEMVAAETAIAAYASGYVTVETTSPALSHQLQMQKSEIIAGLNAALGDSVVRGIRFRLAISARPLAPRPPRQPDERPKDA